MTIFQKRILMVGVPVVLACDGNCCKAWGIQARPSEQLSADEDDTVMLADGELGEAPPQSGNTEGGFDKPPGPHAMNRWCSRQCERSELFEPGEEIEVRDFSQRRYNKPWLHKQTS